jgi:hypothetical protein
MSGSLLLTVYHPGCASRASELLSVRYVITYQDVYAASHCELHTGRVPTCQPHHSMRQTVTLTRNGSLLCSQSGRSREASVLQLWHRAPAATPSVVSLTRERRIELCAIALRVSTLRSTRATSWQALVRFTREESSPSDPQSAIGMCKPHQRCADNRFHHAGCVCRAFRRASYILRWVRYLSTNRMFTPHLSTCELHPGCVCVCRIVAGGIP